MSIALEGTSAAIFDAAVADPDGVVNHQLAYEGGSRHTYTTEGPYSIREGPIVVKRNRAPVDM